MLTCVNPVIDARFVGMVAETQVIILPLIAKIDNPFPGQFPAEVPKGFPLDCFVISTTLNPWQIRDTDSAQVLELIEEKTIVNL